MNTFLHCCGKTVSNLFLCLVGRWLFREARDSIIKWMRKGDFYWVLEMPLLKRCCCLERMWSLIRICQLFAQRDCHTCGDTVVNVSISSQTSQPSRVHEALYRKQRNPLAGLIYWSSMQELTASRLLRILTMPQPRKSLILTWQDRWLLFRNISSNLVRVRKRVASFFHHQSPTLVDIYQLSLKCVLFFLL